MRPLFPINFSSYICTQLQNSHRQTVAENQPYTSRAPLPLAHSCKTQAPSCLNMLSTRLQINPILEVSGYEKIRHTVAISLHPVAKGLPLTSLFITHLLFILSASRITTSIAGTPLPGFHIHRNTLLHYVCGSHRIFFLTVSTPPAAVNHAFNALGILLFTHLHISIIHDPIRGILSNTNSNIKTWRFGVFVSLSIFAMKCNARSHTLLCLLPTFSEFMSSISRNRNSMKPKLIYSA